MHIWCFSYLKMKGRLVILCIKFFYFRFQMKDFIKTFRLQTDQRCKQTQIKRVWKRIFLPIQMLQISDIANKQPRVDPQASWDLVLKLILKHCFRILPRSFEVDPEASWDLVMKNHTEGVLQKRKGIRWIKTCHTQK